MNDIPEELRPVYEQYKNEIPQKLNEIRRSIENLPAENTFENLQQLRFFIHKMGGNAGIFGFRKASDLCKEREEKLRPFLDKKEPLPPESHQELRDFYRLLEESFEPLK